MFRDDESLEFNEPVIAAESVSSEGEEQQNDSYSDEIKEFNTVAKDNRKKLSLELSSKKWHKPRALSNWIHFGRVGRAIAIGTGVIVLVAGVIMYVNYATTSVSVFGVTIKNVSPDSVQDYLSDRLLGELTISTPDYDVVINKSDFMTLELTDEFYDSIYSSSYLDYVGKKLGLGESIESECNSEADLEKFSRCIEDAVAKSGIALKEEKNASIQKTDKEFSLVNEEEGNVIDTSVLLKAIQPELLSTSKSITVTDVYRKPLVRSEDLESVYKGIASYSDWSVNYGKDLTLTFWDVIDWVSIDENNELSIDPAAFDAFLVSVEKAFNTKGANHTFKKWNGETILISGGTYGNTVDLDSEKAFLVDCFNQHKSIKNRIPTMVGDQSDDALTKTYVEISIQDQHLWFYKDGTLAAESDVVTGTKDATETPTGVYYVTEKIPGKYLTGDDYKTWVDRWMRLTNTGIGLHDASWRKDFGGTIYERNGSHGCINLPKDFAYALFDSIETGIPVVIY